MKIECPHCGVRGTLDDAYAGRKIRCPKCKTLFQVGGQQEVTPPIGEQDSVPPPMPPDPETVQEVTEQTAAEAESTTPAAEKPEAVEEAAPPEPDTTQVKQDEVPPMPPPKARPHATREQTYGSDVRFTVGGLISRAWELTNGVKGPLLGGLAVMYGVSMVIVGVITFLIMALNIDENGILANLLNIVNSALSMIFTAGLMYMGVLRATGRQVIWKDVFAGFPISGQIIVASLLQMILVMIGFALLILPGIYLMVGYLMTFPLMLDRSMTPWQAMEASRKAIHKVWWKIFGLYLIVMLILCISAIPFGIGLIWTAPMSIVLCGVVYTMLFKEN
ncbi:zinc-ribbon domain-containing protein [Desulfopila aestuarii]|uniref:MJ0042 family finger-like domain-containing protein n=1 Tax=Desulfopila aestuarii DSM 18488 TaxID=1121416 RepID=A0A1M7Y741_9BACT|nr:zinc-ribbon domain-containing protein [Desulfopila aestuarii]SHO48336.1 MJ0042 family finger-like domain-containing protein [Desulfopila aestuarii DSM 18488]